MRRFRFRGGAARPWVSQIGDRGSTGGWSDLTSLTADQTPADSRVPGGGQPGVVLVPESFQQHLKVRGYGYRELAGTQSYADLIGLWRRGNVPPALRRFVHRLERSGLKRDVKRQPDIVFSEARQSRLGTSDVVQIRQLSPIVESVLVGKTMQRLSHPPREAL